MGQFHSHVYVGIMEILFQREDLKCHLICLVPTVKAGNLDPKVFIVPGFSPNLQDPYKKTQTKKLSDKI